MAEYIEREAAIRFLLNDSPEQVNYSREDATDCIRYMNAADVAPVRHGRWISLTECANEGVYCSICKKKVWKSDYALCSHKSRNKLRSDYCPNCGAKMDGDDGNGDMT